MSPQEGSVRAVEGSAGSVCIDVRFAGDVAGCDHAVILDLQEGEDL